jgi:phytoene synthase
MLDPLAELVRRHDPDRFLTALFAPEDRRPALFTLYAFNHELARAREVASEPMLALIRLHWWREVVQGAERRHEVATPLSAAIAAGLLARDDLLALIDARETEAEPSVPTLAAWRDFLLAGAGGLAVAAGRLLGDLAEAGMRLLDGAQGLRLPRAAVAAGLPGVLARRDLRRGLPSAGPRGLGDRLAVTLAGMTGRL